MLKNIDGACGGKRDLVTRNFGRVTQRHTRCTSNAIHAPKYLVAHFIFYIQSYKLVVGLAKRSFLFIVCWCDLDSDSCTDSANHLFITFSGFTLGGVSRHKLSKQALMMIEAQMFNLLLHRHWRKTRVTGWCGLVAMTFNYAGNQF